VFTLAVDGALLGGMLGAPLALGSFSLIRLWSWHTGIGKAALLLYPRSRRKAYGPRTDGAWLGTYELTFNELAPELERRPGHRRSSGCDRSPGGRDPRRAL
jgi:hypothetical protein